MRVTSLVAGEHYAVRWYVSGSPQECVLLSTDPHCWDPSTKSFGPRPTWARRTPTYLVRRVSNGTLDVVPARYIVSTWADHLVARAAREEAERKAAAARAEYARKRREEAAPMFAHLRWAASKRGCSEGFQAALAGEPRWSSISVDLDDLYRLAGGE